MRLLMVSLLVLIATVAAVLFAQQDSGHIMIAYRDWTIESSLVLFVVGLLILFLALYSILRFWSGIRSMPQNMRRWRRQRRDAKVRNSYLRGMTALGEGQWQAAEKWLIKEVRHSDTPALHYLAAAQAAEGQGSKVRRDSYLRAAAEHDNKAEVAVGLAQASYYLEHHQPKEARSVLGHLHLARPKQAVVLEKLMEASIALQDWEGLLELIPDLERRNVIRSGKAEELQCRAYRGLFAQAGLQRDKERLRQLWERAPRGVRRNEDVLFDYVRTMASVDPHSGLQLDALLAEAIHRRWNDALVYAYGLIPSDASSLPAQLGRAERWLKHHGDNAILLLTLGRLCIRNELWGKGRSYLEASLAIEPLAETYRELGTLLERLNNKGAALDCYRKALTLVPDKSFTAIGHQAPLLLPLLPVQMR